MKKFLAALLSVMLVMSTSITAFGATMTEVGNTLESASKFAFGDKTSFDVSESKDYYLYLISSEYDEEIGKSYSASVKNALDEGKTFDIGTLGLIINNLFLSLEDPTEFEGYDLLDMFEKTELSENDNMYTYMYAADAAYIALLLDYTDLSKQLYDAIISKYTKGVGTDFWGGVGTSADDLAVFILTLSNDYDTYKDYIDDAVALLKAYNTEAGYDNYGANANSTALALAAFTAIDDEEAADDAYHKLMLFYNKETGGFNSNYDNVLATKDAILGLSYYVLLADFDFGDLEEGEDDPYEDDPYIVNPVTPITSVTDKESNKEETNSVKDKNEAKPPVKSPETGAGAATFAMVAMVAAGGVMLVSKKKK